MESNMIILIIFTVLAAVIIVFGLLLILTPDLLIRLTKVLDRGLIIIDIAVLSKRWLWGAIFLVASVYLFYVLFTS